MGGAFGRTCNGEHGNLSLDVVAMGLLCAIRKRFGQCEQR